jgi:hypothetical protein
MGFLQWHKNLAEKIVARIGFYTALWIAFVKGILLSWMVYHFFLK